MACATLNSTILYSALHIIGVQQVFIGLEVCQTLCQITIAYICHLCLCKSTEGWRSLLCPIWEGKFPKVVDTVTQNIRSLSYHCGVIFLLHESKKEMSLKAMGIAPVYYSFQSPILIRPNCPLQQRLPIHAMHFGCCR